MAQRKRSTWKKTQSSPAPIDSLADPVVMREQAPGMIRPLWLGVAPGGGMYAELDAWPESWSTLVRSKVRGSEYQRHKSMEEAAAYLKDFFGREVTYRRWKDREIPEEEEIGRVG